MEIKFKNIQKKIINKKILIITGQNSFKFSGARDRILKLLKKKDTYIYYKTRRQPELQEFLRIQKIINKFKPDMILGIGGGTSIDYSKLSSVFFGQKNIKKIIEKNLTFKIKKKIPTLIIPTTAGTGAEVTKFGTIFIKNKKFSYSSNLVKPNYFSIVPEFSLKSSDYVKASSLMDTICQSTESLFSVNSTKESIKYSLRSLKLAFKNWRKYIRSNDKKSSIEISRSSNFSGKAINIAKTNGPHAVSYYFSTYYNLSHGHAVTLTINSFLFFNFINSKRAKKKININNRFKKLFKITKTNSIKDLNLFYQKIIDNLGLEINFRKLNINIKKEIQNIINETNLDRLKNNPIELDKTDLYRIIQNNEIKNFSKINKV